MKTQGVFAPRTIEEVREQYDEAGPAAQVVVRETAKAMAFDGEEYDERVTSDVVETARDALFASLLEVHVADRETFDDWIAEHDQYDAADVELLGSANVGNVVWHAAPFVESVGEETVDAETVEEETVGEETVDAETVGEETVGEETVDAETVGAESVGEETVDAETVGEETVGEETVGAESVGTKPVVAATFHEQEEAAVGTLRRTAFGRIYRELLEEDG